MSAPPTDDTQPDDAKPEPDGDAQPAKPRANAEAARWRTRLREVEAERDRLAEQLTGLRRRELDAELAETLADPSDFWTVAEHQVEAFLTDDGEVDHERLTEAATALVEAKPHWSANPPKPEVPRRPVEQLRGGTQPDAAVPRSSWHDVLRDATK